MGIASSVSSGKTVYIYSGYLEGLTHLSNALYSADWEAWQEISRTLSPQVVQDWRDNSDYWQRYESPVEEAATAVYDGYLKHNQQESGIKSYGQCVDLLVEYYKDKI